MSQRTFYPLGHGVFASVKTYKQHVQLYLKRFRVTKTGRIVQATSIGLSQKQFLQLLHIKDRLCKAYDEQMSLLDQQHQQQQHQRPLSVSRQNDQQQQQPQQQQQKHSHSPRQRRHLPIDDLTSECGYAADDKKDSPFSSETRLKENTATITTPAAAAEAMVEAAHTTTTPPPSPPPPLSPRDTVGKKRRKTKK